MKEIATGWICIWLLLTGRNSVANEIPQSASVTLTVEHALSSVIVVELTPVFLKARTGVPDQRKIKLDTENTGQLILMLKGPVQIKIMNVWPDSSLYYFLLPGTDFSLHLDTRNRQFRKTGRVGERENNFHYLITEKAEASLKQIAWMEPEVFIPQWKQLAKNLSKLIDSATASGLDSSYAAWDRRNIASLLQEALRQQLVSYVTIKGRWPVNTQEFRALATNYSDAELNDPFGFTAEGDKELVAAYFLFPTLLQFYQNNDSPAPPAEVVYTAALKLAAKIGSPDIRNLMLEFLLTKAVSETTDLPFLKSISDDFLATPRQKYLRGLVQTRLELLKAAPVGQPAPQFAARDPDGRPFSYGDYAGSFLFIDIWATWCHPCVAQFPEIEKLKIKYAGKPIRFISVSIDRNEKAWGQFLHDRNLAENHFHSAPDRSNGIRNIYQAKYIPAFVLIDPDGKLISPSCFRPSDPSLGWLLDRLLP